MGYDDALFGEYARSLELLSRFGVVDFDPSIFRFGKGESVRWTIEGLTELDRGHVDYVIAGENCIMVHFVLRDAPFFGVIRIKVWFTADELDHGCLETLEFEKLGEFFGDGIAFVECAFGCVEAISRGGYEGRYSGGKFGIRWNAKGPWNGGRFEPRASARRNGFPRTPSHDIRMGGWG